MSKPAAVVGDMVMQTPPVHCHQLHPMGPAQVPIPSPVAPPLKFPKGAKKVKIGGKLAVRVGDKTTKCMLAVCVKPASGPGKVMLGSFKVKIENKFAARMMDMTLHAKCVAPIPAPQGKIMGPCVPTVLIG